MTSSQWKPQNCFSSEIKDLAQKQVTKWFTGDFDIEEQLAEALALNLVDRAISDRIAKTHSSAPNVFLSEKAKIETLVFSAQAIAIKLNEENCLENILI